MRSNSVPDVYDRYADHYRRHNEISVDIPSAVEDKQYEANLTRYLPADRSVPVLDLGCGMGHLMLYLGRQGFTTVDGVDVSRTQIEQCLRYGLTTVKHVADSAEFLRQRPAYYGLITSFDVMEHVPDDALLATISAVHDSLQPGGSFVMRVPNAAGVTAMWSRYRDITHCRLFTEISAQQVMEAPGFTNIRVTKEITAYNARFLGWGFERVRSLLYARMRLLYRLQSPGSAIPTVFTSNLYAVGERPRA